MKIPALLTCLLAAVLSVLPVSAARADDVSFDVFYNSLGDDGDWYNTPEFGYVWQPSIAYNNAKWRPYSDGYWAQTDDGWTWVSYENFGWATYHYGRWTNLENTGWVWVPGYDWGPGWVSWRTSNDYVGWAPLPPKRASAPNVRGSDRVASVDYNTVEDEGGYYDDVDQQYDIGPANYCFVQTADFGAPVLREVIVPPQRNIVIVENTFNVTRITYRRDNNFVIVHNEGPDFGFIRTRVHQPIQELRIERRDDVGFLRDRGPERRNPNVVRNGVFQIAAPRITRQQVNFNQVRPPRVKQELADPRVEHGWSNSGGDQATVQRVREQFQQQARNNPNRTEEQRRVFDQQRQQVNVPPAPNVTPGDGQGGFRADADRQARRDAAQRDRDQRDAARNGGNNNPPAGAQPFNQGGNQPPTANNGREDRRDQRQQAEQAQQAQQAEQRQQRQQAEQAQQAERQQQRQQAEQNQQNTREQRQQREQAEQGQRQQQQRQQREQQQQQRQQEQQQRQQAEQTQRQQQQEQRQPQREGSQQDQPQREQRQQEQAQRQQEQQAARQQQQEQQAQERQQRQGAQQAQRQQEQDARQQQQEQQAEQRQQRQQGEQAQQPQQAERQQQRQQAEQGQRQQQQERAQQPQQEHAQQQQQRQQEQSQRRQEPQPQRQQPQQQQQGNSDDDKRKQHPNN